ncbi:SusC/RagA family TonB-linked outer membrane protein [Hufsiella ginkgonis]|uniref:SusC/RagA family TonB-linked outer membrane protein n=1 Tax=Hufsiella ginkgonis TaxID=2695274 RepID=A0A7K1Y475_9SPHI|nr:SusC/RagA family TonB-linked outer membrane protein [Hufsiella ginkgonis]MXV17667.1 SusC/RagA family TonB-linked outer membrane protein [Hufsiella ginkgonis]
MCTSVQSYAQSVSSVVRGKVTEKATGLPLPGVTVTERNKDGRLVNGVVTNEAGEYQIKVADQADSLRFSQIGLRTLSRAIKGAAVINVTMADDATTLSDIAITTRQKKLGNSGGFLDIDKRDQTAAISSIDMKDLEDIPATSVDQVLEGKVSGLLISMNSGDPGSGSSIQIRGAASLGLGSKPLIVVDDIPFTTPEGADINTTEGLSALLSISVADIATIDILKDAAATALYGSDGANGVIAIRTKRGSNLKPTITVSTNLMVKLPQTPLPMLNGDQYKTMMLEAYQNRYGTTGIDLTSNEVRYLFLEKGAIDYENYNNNTSWLDQINENGFKQDYSAQISGGGEAAKYVISVGFLDDKGPIIGSELKKMNGRFNFDYKISDKLKFASDFAYSDQQRKASYDNNLGIIALNKAPVLPIFTQDEFGNNLSTYFNPANGTYQNGVRNPVAVINNSLNTTRSNRLDATVNVRFSPFKGFQFNSNINNAYEGSRVDRFLPLSASGVEFYRVNNFRLLANGSENASNFVPQNYSKLFVKNDFIYTVQGLGNKQSLQGGVFTRYTNENTKGLSFDGSNTPSEFLTSPYATDVNTSMRSSVILSRDLVLTGQLAYIFDDRYSVQGVLTRQGNSIFGSNHRFGTFPAVSAFWRPSSEPFIKGKYKWLDDLKFRFSWGITGRAPSTNVVRYTDLAFTAASPFADIQGVSPLNMELSDLRWEKAISTNVGMNLSLFKGRLSFVTDFSKSKTKDMILTRNLPTTTGFQTSAANYGDLGANIWEGEVSGIPVSTKKWRMTTSFNISTTQTKILSLPNNLPVIRNNVFDNRSFMSLVSVGNPLGTFYGLKYEGVYSRDEDAFAKDASGNFITDFNGQKIPVRWLTSTGEAFTGGDARYADLNHDGVINRQDVTAIGNATPKFFGGFMLRLNYNRRWEIFGVFNFQQGFDLQNYARMTTTSMYDNYNQSTAVLSRWRKQGDVTDMPRALYGGGHNFVGSDRYIEDASFLKCNQLILSYKMPANQLQKLRVKQADFSFTISNVFTLTHYSGMDPSINNRNDPFVFGVDNAYTPNPITYNLGMRIAF